MKELEQISTQIKEQESQRKKLARKLREKEKHFQKISKANLNGLKILGVDGGFLRKDFHGATLILRRAVGVMFRYKENNLDAVAYYPSKNPMPEPIVFPSHYSEQEISVATSLKRVELELRMAMQTAKEIMPNLIILDGSIVLYPSSIPPKNSPIYEIYSNVIKILKQLYAFCEKNNILLAGAIEDSHGKKFCKLMKQEHTSDILDCTTDTLFLYDFLKPGERTNSFIYSDAPEDLPILKDLGKFGEQIYSMYLKPVEFDRPLRVDFLNKDNAELVASVVYAISKQNRNYAYPSVLIEADARAKLKEHEINVFKSILKDKLGRNIDLQDLRRDNRPF